MQKTSSFPIPIRFAEKFVVHIEMQGVRNSTYRCSSYRGSTVLMYVEYRNMSIAVFGTSTKNMNLFRFQNVNIHVRVFFLNERVH